MRIPICSLFALLTLGCSASGPSDAPPAAAATSGAATTATPAENPPASPPQSNASSESWVGREIFADDELYRSLTEQEQTFEGVLQRLPDERVGLDRRNPYTLAMESGSVELYVGSEAAALKAYVSKRVTVVGKLREYKVEHRQRREIWPARISTRQ